MMSDQPYTKPPITEAVVEIRFAEALDASELDKAARQLKSVYNNEEHTRNVAFAVDVPSIGPVQTTLNEQLGRRMSSDDLTQIVILWPSSFVVAQLAPYPGWQKFFGRILTRLGSLEESYGLSSSGPRGSSIYKPHRRSDSSSE